MTSRKPKAEGRRPKEMPISKFQKPNMSPHSQNLAQTNSAFEFRILDFKRHSSFLP
jgi:hypothetical protein